MSVPSSLWPTIKPLKNYVKEINIARTLTPCKLGYVERQNCRETVWSAFLHGRSPLVFERCRQEATVPAYHEFVANGEQWVPSTVQLGRIYHEDIICTANDVYTTHLNKGLIVEIIPDPDPNVLAKAHTVQMHWMDIM